MVEGEGCKFGGHVRGSAEINGDQSTLMLNWEDTSSKNLKKKLYKIYVSLSEFTQPLRL